MHAPDFWWHRRPSLFARLLQPLGILYGAITARRMKQPGASTILPVICVGNFVAGGAGKTPTAIALAQHLNTLGFAPSFLTRGYGGEMEGPVLLPHDAQTEMAYTHLDVGDEPFLLARHAPVMVARDRLAGIQVLQSIKPIDKRDVVIMDDGLQNPAIRKALTFAVIDGHSGIGNGLCIPAGPMRAPLAQQWPHVDAVVIIGAGDAGNAIAKEACKQGKPVFTAHLEPSPDAVKRIKGRRVLAFAGIGRPQKFFYMLEKLGANVVYTKAFPDHAPFSPGEIAALEYEALQQDLLPVTTEKDAVRLQSITCAPYLRSTLTVMPVQLVFHKQEELQEYLLETVKRYWKQQSFR